jgi:hypothetical protein
VPRLYSRYDRWTDFSASNRFLCIKRSQNTLRRGMEKPGSWFVPTASYCKRFKDEKGRERGEDANAEP